ncbi:MAG: formylglycine-generating enzyme family protein, partial [Nitrososphaerales archaeon]
VRAALEALAFTVHDRQRTGAEREGPADIGEADLLRAFRPLLGKLGPDELLVYLRDRSGILVALGEDTYAFPHRSFQEYLAACHLARGANFAQRLRGLACSDPSWWREVCLLGAGKARQGGMGAALNLVSAFIRETVEEVGQPCAEHWRLAVLAGQALVELRVTEKVDDQPDAAVLLKRSRRWLAQLVEGGRLPPRERAEAGDVLGQLGDPRFDPQLYYLPCRYRGQPEPQHGFVEIPASRFLIGSQRDDEGGYPDEYDADGKPTEVDIPYRYWMARYPVTVAQYGAFLEDGGGAENSPWWTEAGRRWRRCEWDSRVTEDWLKDWLKQRPLDRRGKPLRWSEQERYPNRPVMYVSWFEAVAYCRWLDGRLRADGWPPPGYEVRLPTEAEWERAARGATQRQYAWGDESWDEDRVNIESRVGRAAAVGLYPRGATPDTELHDLAGNLWEWTATLYQPYPYKEDDGRNRREADVAGLLGGGCWH